MTEFLLDGRPGRVYWEPRVNRFVAEIETKDGKIGAVGMKADEAIKFLGDKLRAMQQARWGS